jgi:hypothetical protein
MLLRVEGEHQMAKSVCMALLATLWICPYLLMQSPCESAEAPGQPGLQVHEAQFEGMYRRVLGNDPATLSR